MGDMYVSTSFSFGPSEIRGIRAALGMTQADFAAQIGVCQGTVSLWESGEVNPRGPANMLLRTLQQRAAKKSAKKRTRRIQSSNGYVSMQ